jgi:hypothetical protein
MMNIGVIDVNTCEPLPNVLVDIWVSSTNVSSSLALLDVPKTDPFQWPPRSTPTPPVTTLATPTRLLTSSTSNPLQKVTEGVFSRLSRGPKTRRPGLGLLNLPTRTA